MGKLEEIVSDYHCYDQHGDCYDSCQECENSLREDLIELIAEVRADAIDEFKKNVLTEFCEACNQVSCDGGTEGSTQECSTIRTLRYVVNQVAEELKEQKNEI